MRTLTRMSSEPPTMRKAPSSNTRNKSPCPLGDRSPISSRNSVPPSASWKRPGLLRGGAGERAFDVAEQFGFEQLFGKGGAVDGDERFVVPLAVGVDQPGGNFLAGAAFAFDQHGDIALRDFLNQPGRRRAWVRSRRSAGVGRGTFFQARAAVRGFPPPRPGVPGLFAPARAGA